MHQERNLSIIIEILESSPMTAREHFQELAEMNEASNYEIVKVHEKENGSEVDGGVWGWQEIRGERVWIGVGLKREEQADADLLLSINSDREADMQQLPLLMRSLVLKDPSLFE